MKVRYAARKMNSSGRSTIFKFIIRFFYFGLIITGMLGPSFGINETEAKTAGKDIYLAIDLSESMNADDVSPSRLDKLKFEMIKSLEQLKNNRLGIIIFSSEAYWLVPLTFDTDVIKNYIEQLNTNMLQANGTNLNAPISLVNNHIIETKTREERARVILLFTDGEDFANVGKDSLLPLQKLETRLFIIGVGTAEGGNIITNGVYLKDSNSVEAYTKLNKEKIIQMAQWSGTKPGFLNNELNDLNAVLGNIESYENKLMDSRKILVANNKYIYFLVGALILVALDMLITVKLIKI